MFFFYLVALVGLYNSHTKSIQSLAFLVILLGPFHCATLRSEPVGSSSAQTKIKIPKMGILILVALVGLEPTLIAELDFESSASTNSATGPKHRQQFIMRPVLLQLFSPNARCDSPCVQVFLQGRLVCRSFFQWPF